MIPQKVGMSFLWIVVIHKRLHVVVRMSDNKFSKFLFLG